MQGRADNCAAGSCFTCVTFLHNKAARRGQGICIEHFEGDSELKKNIQHHYIPVIQLHSEAKLREEILHRICQQVNVCTATMYLIGCRQREHYRCGMAFGGRILRCVLHILSS
ncbi:uncharacterized protein LOC144908499 isoform X1 [Branchiostoma floridae x Branchiostoma belcheri]